MAKRKVTIVVPIYGDWPSLAECIDSLKEHVGTGKHRVMLVNDCGPEADELERNIKQAIKETGGFVYHRNKKNLGFIGTCNRAVMELDRTDNDILLLNSDTKVTPSFLEEMLGVLYAEEKIGAVSPRSNNATICTIPISAINQKGIEPQESYNLFKKYKDKFPRYNEAPTAHGFCMLIRREVIKKHGLFDPVFGRGYGEEVDLCQRTKKHGWVSAISHHSYVFHLEAKSFSLETKAKLLEQNNKIIRKRYPDYKQSVTDYIERAKAQEQKIMGQDAMIGVGKTTPSFVKRIIRRSPLARRLMRAVRKR